MIGRALRRAVPVLLLAACARRAEPPEGPPAATVRVALAPGHASIEGVAVRLEEVAGIAHRVQEAAGGTPARGVEVRVVVSPGVGPDQTQAVLQAILEGGHQRFALDVAP